MAYFALDRNSGRITVQKSLLTTNETNFVVIASFFVSEIFFPQAYGAYLFIEYNRITELIISYRNLIFVDFVSWTYPLI